MSIVSDQKTIKLYESIGAALEKMTIDMRCTYSRCTTITVLMELKYFTETD